MDASKNKTPRLVPLSRAIASVCEALRNCEATPNHPWAARWSSLLDAIESNLLPSGGGFDAGTKIDREATNDRRISLTFDFHHMDEHGFYSGWTSHTVTINPTFSGTEIRVSGSNKGEVRDYANEVFSNLFSPSNLVAYSFDDNGEAVLIQPDMPSA